MRFDKQETGRRDVRGRGRRGLEGLAMMARIGRGPFGGGGRFGGPFGDGFDDDGAGPRGHGRRRRMFGGGELRLLLLHLLGQDQRHGYELIKAIEDLAGGHYAPSPGVVYPTLSLLVDEGLIAEIAGEGARKAFRATASGAAEAQQRTGEIEAIIGRLQSLAEAGGPGISPPVLRAMANLKMALRQRTMAGLDTTAIHQIADILDEAARKVERL